MAGPGRATGRMTADSGLDDNPWSGVILDWKDQASWVAHLTEWLTPCLRRGALRRLAREPNEHLYLDDPAWVERVAAETDLDIELLVEDLADDLMGARVRAYHGCRLADAGAIHAGGLKRNDPSVLAEEVRQIVAAEDGLAWLRADLEAKIADFEHRERDTGCLYVVADDRPLAEDSGHYLLYGSEWIQVLLGWGAHDSLRRRGAPTVIALDLPLSVVHSSARTGLASDLLREWGRQQAARDGVSPNLDFSFVLRRDVPSDWIVAHTHPARIRDPFYQMTIRRNPFLDCPHCRSANA